MGRVERGAYDNLKGVYVLVKTDPLCMVLDCDARLQFIG